MGTGLWVQNNRRCERGHDCPGRDERESAVPHTPCRHPSTSWAWIYLYSALLSSHPLAAFLHGSHAPLGITRCTFLSSAQTLHRWPQHPTSSPLLTLRPCTTWPGSPALPRSLCFPALPDLVQVGRRLVFLWNTPQDHLCATCPLHTLTVIWMSWTTGWPQYSNRPWPHLHCSSLDSPRAKAT